VVIIAGGEGAMAFQDAGAEERRRLLSARMTLDEVPAPDNWQK
jgi:hypothetical protein